METEFTGFYTSMLNGNEELEENLSTPPLLQPQPTDQDMNQSHLVQKNDNPTSKRGRQQGFTKEEDILLISCYLNTSIDPIMGSGQKQDAFWKRIHASFVSDGKYARTQMSLSSRWNTLNKDVSKFVGCYAQVQQQQESGLNEQDRIIKAETLFKTSTGKNFQFLHCWNKLKNEIRWTSTSSYDRSNKASKSFPGSSPSGASSSPTTPESINLGDDCIDMNVFERPEGRKAAKEKLRKSKEHVSTSTTVLQAWKEEYIENERSKKERIEKQLKYQEEYIAIEKLKTNNDIMRTDTTCMDETRATYFKKLQQDILDSL